MKKGLSLVALLVLSFTMGTMFVYLIVDGYGRSYFSLSLLLVFVVLWLINMATKFKEVDKSEVDFKVKESIFSFLAILIPTLIVYLATTYLEQIYSIVSFVSRSNLLQRFSSSDYNWCFFRNELISRSRILRINCGCSNRFSS